jgi:hypothetical protein
MKYQTRRKGEYKNKKTATKTTKTNQICIKTMINTEAKAIIPYETIALFFGTQTSSIQSSPSWQKIQGSSLAVRSQKPSTQSKPS